MKRVFLVLAVTGYLLCAVRALWPVPAGLYFTAAYVGMTCCALAALFCVAKPQRWLPVTALLFGLIGALVCWQGSAQTVATSSKPRQAWVRWAGNDRWYALTPAATNWLAAQDLAVSEGGNLAIIRNASEQDFINTTFLTGTLEHRPVWIGLLRKGANGKLGSRVRLAMEDLGVLHPKAAIAVAPTSAAVFEWVTGEPISYSNWKPGQPDNFPPGEQYVTINWHYSDNPPRGTKGDWNDAPLNGTTGFGGTTTGPYFGLVERGSDPNQRAILTPSQLRLATWGWLLVATVLAVIFLTCKSLESK